MNQDWHIKSRSTVCCETGRAFDDGESFFTALYEDPENEGFLRKDFSEKAWDEMENTDTPRPFSFWRSKFEAPVAVEEIEVVKKENAETLLRRLIEEDDKATENSRYILAVMLERKKILVQTDTQKVRGGRLLIYERKGTGEAFIVKDPQLKLEEIESVQLEVSELLGGGPVAIPVAKPEPGDEAGAPKEEEETVGAAGD